MNERVFFFCDLCVLLWLFVKFGIVGYIDNSGIIVKYFGNNLEFV